MLGNIIERIENDINGSRLILENNDEINVGYKERMLLENHIPGFLECNVVKADGHDRYVYDITAKTSIYNIYEHEEMDYKILYGFINSVVCGLESAGEYLLPPEHLLLDPRYIYVDSDTGRICWCYYPGGRSTLKDGMNGLAEYILQKADHKDKAAISLAYGMYKQIANEDYTLRRLLHKHDILTETVEKTGDENDDNILIEDDKDLYPPDEDDAPVIPRAGKVIIAVCLLIVLIMSGFVFAAVLYKNSYLLDLISLNEMRIFICMTEAMAMLLPILITVRWINRTRKFKKLLLTAEEKDGADLYRQVCFGTDCLNQAGNMV